MVHNPYTQYLGIYLKLYPQGILYPEEDANNISSFDMYQNAYVTQHFKEFVCVWTRLALEYENFEMYEKFIDKYILFKTHIKHYVQIIETGSRFRKHCWMHKLSVEIRKKIYDMILKQFAEHLLECREFSKRLFPN